MGLLLYDTIILHEFNWFDYQSFLNIEIAIGTLFLILTLYSGLCCNEENVVSTFLIFVFKFVFLLIFFPLYLTYDILFNKYYKNIAIKDKWNKDISNDCPICLN